jgi:predicted secreted protein
MSRNTVALALLLSLLVPFSLASAEFRDMSVMVEGRPTECGITCLDEDDDGRTIHVRRSELVLIRLRSNPSTGNNWHIEELDTDVVLPLCNAFVPDDPDLFGSPGDLKWFFQAESAGETDLVLKYYRIWEGPDSASKTLHLRFVVH